MTNAEIIKALECCLAKDVVNDRCDECPNLAMGAYCMDRMLKDALNLINRQKAEIEFAKNINHLQMEELQTANSEIERLNGLLKEWKKAGYKYADSFDSIKSEAIKEFAERLKAKMRNRALFSVVDTVDEIVNEMAGANDA